MKSKVPDAAELLDGMFKRARNTAKPRLGSLLAAAIDHKLVSAYPQPATKIKFSIGHHRAVARVDRT